MESSSIFQISWPSIINLISEAKKRVRLILPSIHSEWVILLEDVQKNGVDVRICLNNTEKEIREGFGSDSAIEKLLDLDIPVNESKSNRISLISVDNKHFLYFPTSRIFEDTTTDGGISNAIAIDMVTATSILSSFFPEDLNTLRGTLADNSMIISELFQEKLEEVKEDLAVGRIDAQARVFDKKKFDEIQTKIKKNPPIEPDLRRAIDVYNLKIQFVELRFENGKITGKRVRIPKKALPFESPELKRIIDAGMKIFNDGKNNEGCALDVYSIIQDDVKKLRERYLTPIKCRPEKSILIKEKKFYFKIEVDKINKKIEAEKLKLINDIDSEIERAKGKFEKELNAFFLRKPPEEIGMYYSYEKIPGKINNYVKGLISTMKFPKAHEMVEGMKLRTHYYDLTWNDFSDQELIEEFGAKGILREDLNSIRELSKAIKEKK